MVRRLRTGDPTDAALRASRPSASDAFVAELSERVASRQRSPRPRSRLALGSAMLVFVVGVFASFGGVGYAASGAQGTVKAMKQAVAPNAKHITASAKTSADGEYGEDSVPVQPPKVLQEPAKTTGIAKPTKSSGTLPFTGFGLAGTAIVGSALLGLGIVLRRREARR